jgi:nitronate monooxygenase
MKPEEIFADMLVPVICAPMFTVSGPELVTACGRAGIMGVLPAGTARTAEEFSGWVDQVSADLAAHSDKTGKPAGPWAANLSAGSALRNGEERAKAEIAACQKHKPKLVITVGGDPTDLVKIVHDWGGLVFHDVTTLKHTEKAIDAGVDGLILIGGGGGVHTDLHAWRAGEFHDRLDARQWFRSEEPAACAQARRDAAAGEAVEGCVGGRAGRCAHRRHSHRRGTG